MIADGSAEMASRTSTTLLRRAPRTQRSPLTSPHVLQGCTRALDPIIILSLGWLTYGIRNEWRMMDDASLVALSVGGLLGTQLFAAFGVYGERWVGKTGLLLPRLIGAWAATIAGVLVAMFMFKSGHSISRLWIGGWAILGAVTLAASRLVIDGWIARAQRAGVLFRNLVVVGGNARLIERASAAIGQDPTLRIVATSFFRPGEELTDLSLLRQAIRTEQQVDMVVLALNDEERLNLAGLLQELKQFPCETCLLTPALDETLPVCGIRKLGRLPALTLLETPIDGWHRVLKEIEDRVVAGVLLTALAPFLLMVALAVRLSSPGPALFRQTRLGFDLQLIEVLKFRTMYADACDPPLSDDVAHACRDDPRVTPLGRWLRRTSIDELPQLINVLRGEMSLVGPRPHAVAHDHHYSELVNGYLGRHRVKPGMTGWAQVNGFRGEITDVDAMRQRIEHDLYYIDNWSIWFDLRILLRTVFVVGFNHENAY